MNLLITINVRWWNAEAAYALNLARAFKENGHNVWILPKPDSPIIKKAHLAGIPTLDGIDLDSNNPFRQFLNYGKLMLYIEQLKIDVINSFKSAGSFHFSSLRKKFPNLIYIKTRGEARPPKPNAFNRYLYGVKGCHGVITVGKKVETWVMNLHIPDQKVQTIYYADSSVQLPEEVNTAEVKQNLGIPENRPVFCLLGRTQPVKGHMEALEALRLMNYPKPHYLFLVKDLEEFPDTMKKIDTYLKEHVLEDHVTILGFRPDLGEILKTVNAAIIPSLDSEVNCRVTVEMFSMGIPVIAFPTGTLPELIENHKTGMITTDKTPDALKEAMNWFMEYPERFQTLGENAETDYREKYTLDTLYKETLNFYKDCGWKGK